MSSLTFVLGGRTRCPGRQHRPLRISSEWRRVVSMPLYKVSPWYMQAFCEQGDRTQYTGASRSLNRRKRALHISISTPCCGIPTLHDTASTTKHGTASSTQRWHGSVSPRAQPATTQHTGSTAQSRLYVNTGAVAGGALRGAGLPEASQPVAFGPAHLARARGQAHRRGLHRHSSR